jgi:hypothetical protein
MIDSMKIYYVKDDFLRDFAMGTKFLTKHPDECEASIYDVDKCKYHELVNILPYDNEKNLIENMNYAFGVMQAERWSPNGEARELLDRIGTVHHTSMSVGDMIQMGKDFFVVENFGFYHINTGMELK